MPINQYPAHYLGYELYIESGIRGNASNINIENYGEEKKYVNEFSLLRLSIPRRTYTDNHMKYVVENLNNIWGKRESKYKGFSLEYPNNNFFKLSNYTLTFRKN